jgi:hypothetical protein
MQEALASYTPRSMVDAFLAVIVQIARDNSLAAVALPTHAGMHLLSNHTDIEADIRKRFIDRAKGGNGKLELTDSETWLEPPGSADAPFDAYKRGANTVSTVYVVWAGRS